MQIVKLTPDYAADAARLHIAGQPGTFLTDLGPDVLGAVYAALPSLPSGFGYLALCTGEKPSHGEIPDQVDNVLGFVSATTSTGRLFVEMGLRQSGRLLPPLLSRFVRRPGLVWRSMQTVLYPMLIHESPQTERTDTAPVSSAELLSIMVEPAARGQGIGSQLVRTLVQACAARGICRLDVTVDELNQGAQRFYRRHGFALCRTFHMYGRTMCLYQLVIDGQDAVENSVAANGQRQDNSAAGPPQP